MNIHIIPNDKFTEKFINLIETEYPDGSNYIYIYEINQKFVKKQYSNVKYIKDFRREIDLSIANGDNDKIFIHGYFSWYLLLILSIRLKRKDFKKVVVIVWGGDLYDERLKLKESIDFKLCIHEMIKKRFLKKVRMYMTFASSDFEILCKWYHTRGVQFDCLYPSNIDKTYLDNIKKETFPKKEISILIGNSASETNQHVDIINTLSQYKNENIQIICPLSYGDKEYGRKIEEYGKKVFGEKFIAIKEYMSPEKYSDLLNSVEIAVFNHNRQQATGNIEILAYLGKKIYVRSDTTTWAHYVIRDHCNFFDTMEIKNMDFKEFICVSENEIKENIEYFTKIWDIKYVKSLWDKVMNYRVE